MSITVSAFRDSVLRLINVTNPALYSDLFYVDALTAAQDAILPWRPKLVVSSVTLSSELEYIIDTDLYAIEAVTVVETKEVLPRHVFAPALAPSARSSNAWVEMPDGKLRFYAEIASGSIVDVWYLKHYTRPTAIDSSTFDIPNTCIMAARLYAGAYLLQPDAVNAATIGQYKTRIDSGGPEDNPLNEQIRFMLTMFKAEMDKHPRYQRAAT